MSKNDESSDVPAGVSRDTLQLLRPEDRLRRLRLALASVSQQAAWIKREIAAEMKRLGLPLLDEDDNKSEN